MPAYQETGRTVKAKTDGAFNVGLSAKVLSLLPFDINGHRHTRKTYTFEIETIESRKFIPSPHYVRQSVLQTTVLSYLAKHRYRKSLYMIVGIKIARNAKVAYGGEHDLGGGLSASIPGAAMGVPVEVGGSISASTLERHHDKYQVPNAFVFAYRLREIRYSKKSGFIDNNEHTKGADLHHVHSHKLSNTNLNRTDSKEFLGIEDEIEIDGISGVDLDEDKDSKVVDGCVMVGLQGE